MITIIDYEAGNLTSVARALVKTGHECEITGDPDKIAAADRVIFPGVGAAGSAMASLKRSGMGAAISAAVGRGVPVMGICLGTQVILEHSSENNAQCLGIVSGRVAPFATDMVDGGGCRLKIPHMGWNAITLQKAHPVFDGIVSEDRFYFVHSYYPAPADPSAVIATTVYGVTFASVIGFDNLVATQFHPEKSGRAGLRILDNFCRWAP